MVEENKYEELVGIAGEYVLGTLDDRERREFEQRMKGDAALENAVTQWQSRLDPLAQAVQPVSPPADLFDKISLEIEGSAPREHRATAQVIELKKRVKRWRTTAVMAGAMAASLALFVAVKQFNPIDGPPQEGAYMAVLQADDKSPQFVASIDLQNGRIDIVRLGAKPSTGKSYELWAVGGGRDKPQSLGVMDRVNSVATTPLLQTLDNGLEKTVFAVSLEPAGGSPTGQPTGPVLFTGKLVKIEDR